MQIFCRRCNKQTEQELTLAAEIQAHCTNPVIVNEVSAPCGHVTKFPRTTDAKQLQSWIDIHNEANAPAITAEVLSAQDASINEMLQGLNA